jgi:hypothetical protein
MPIGREAKSFKSLREFSNYFKVAHQLYEIVWHL